MSARTKRTRQHRRVIFLRRTKRPVANSTRPRPKAADEEIPPHNIPDRSVRSVGTATTAAAMVPDLFLTQPPVRDILVTDSSVAQDDTAERCLPFHYGEDGDAFRHSDGVPRLYRARHAKFLRANLETLPSAFISVDASRPWFLYWCLNALTLLGEDVSSYAEALIDTARSMQNPSGGFGGGYGQTSHLATTYATVLALAIVGGESCYDVVDRRALWKWLCSLKQADGGFRMSVGGEEDIRYVDSWRTAKASIPKASA